MSSPEKRKRVKQRIRIKNEKIQKLTAFIILVFIAAVIVALITGAFIYFALRVRKFDISGDTEYKKEQIINATGIDIGHNLIFLDTVGTAENVEKALPYCDNVRVTKKLPSTLVVRTQKAVPVYAFAINETTFALTNSNLKVLEISGTVPEGIIGVQSSALTQYSEGSILQFVSGESGEDTIGYLTEISAAFEKTDFIKNINALNITDSKSIYVIYQDRIVIRLGDSKNLTQKLSLASKAIREEDANSDKQTGVLDVSSPEKAVFAAKDINSIPELSAWISAVEDDETVQEAAEGITDKDNNNNEEEKSQ
ncbi:MAG: FtsQ-type POTRA domain-containing protein [Clostridiales bacterium]|nr:FtsQ-type POTRA domain-containing protein [Clostridiales bacterium]